MKKKLLTLIVGLSIFSGIAQEKILEFKNELKTSSSELKDVVPIVNKENGDVSIFIADAKNVYGYKFDKNFKLIEKLASEEKRRKYKTIIGNSIEDNGSYLVYLTNKKKNKFAFTRFSFKEKKSSVIEFKLKPNEKFIQTASINNKFYLISGDMTNRDLFINSFDDKGVLKRNKIDIEGSFVTHAGTIVKPGQLLMKNGSNVSLFNPTKERPLTKIEENTPNSIENVSAERKMYIRGNNLFFSFDHHKEYTQVLELDLKTMKGMKKEFKKPLNNIKSNRKKTNSFILKNKIFVIGSTKDVFSMHILDYKTGEFIKEYTVTKDENIPFKNSPIIQKGGMYNNYRKLEKTKKFLRKITAGKIGLSVIEQNNNYIATIGGYVEQASGGGMGMPGFGGIPMGSFGNVTVFFNPSAFAYNSFSNTKSTQIECVLDAELNHVEGEVSKNAFDKIRDTKFGYIQGKTVFKYDGYYIKGYYKPRLKKYFLTKFTNN